MLDMKWMLDETLLLPFQVNLEIISFSLRRVELFVCRTKVNTLQRSDIEVNATKGKKCPKTVKIVDRDLVVISSKQQLFCSGLM